MFEAIVSKDTLEAFLAPVTAVVEDCRVQLGDDGVAITAVDEANVALVDVELDADAFETFEATGGEIGLNADRLEAIVGMAPKDALIRLELNHATRRLDIAFHRVDYSLATLDVDSLRETPSMPDLKLPATVGIDAGEFSRALALAGFVADELAFGVDADAAVFYVDAKGDTDDVHIEHAADELAALTAADVRSRFSLDYLGEMDGAIPGDAEVTLELGDSMPVRLSFEFAEDHGRCQYALSPRVRGDAE